MTALVSQQRGPEFLRPQYFIAGYGKELTATQILRCSHEISFKKNRQC